jgi:hypothetical protein
VRAYRTTYCNWYRCLTSIGYRHGTEVAPGPYAGSGLGTPCTLAHALSCLQVTAQIRSRGLFSLAHYVYETSDGEKGCWGAEEVRELRAGLSLTCPGAVSAHVVRGDSGTGSPRNRGGLPVALTPPSTRCYENASN